MGALKDKQLEKLAGGVADERHDQAESKAVEAGYIQAAQKRMQALNITVFTAHGIEFVRVPGEEKFRVRLTGDGVKDAGAGEGDSGDGPPEPEFDTDGDGRPIDEGEGEGDEGAGDEA